MVNNKMRIKYSKNMQLLSLIYQKSSYQNKQSEKPIKRA